MRHGERRVSARLGADASRRHHRWELSARNATAHVLCAVPPEDARILLFAESVHLSYKVGDDLIITASSPIGAAQA